MREIKFRDILGALPEKQLKEGHTGNFEYIWAEGYNTCLKDCRTNLEKLFESENV